MSIGFLPGFSIIIRAIFNDLGQNSSRSIAFNIYIGFTGPSVGSYFSIPAVIRSTPGAFFCFNVLISSFFLSEYFKAFL